MKPSGIEWLGDVPEHWEVTRLSRLASSIGDGLHGTPEYIDESEFHFINGNNLVDGSISITETTGCVSEAEFNEHRSELDVTTVLLSINGTIGNLALYRGESVMLGKSAAYIKCGNRLAREYLYWLLQSTPMHRYFEQSATGTTISNLSLDSVRRLPWHCLQRRNNGRSLLVSTERPAATTGCYSRPRRPSTFSKNAGPPSSPPL
jgi:type I restriction enzyme S subunit